MLKICYPINVHYLFFLLNFLFLLCILSGSDFTLAILNQTVKSDQTASVFVEKFKT